MRPRTLVLWGALVATLAATWWSAVTDEETETAVATRRGGEVRSSAPEAAPAGDGLRVAREPWPAWGADIFRPLESPLPPPSAAAPAPPPASAPPLPFRYVGSLEEGRQRAVILLEGDDMHIRRAGQRIGDRYRIERITATEIEFLHIPTMQRQVLVTSLHEQYR